MNRRHLRKGVRGRPLRERGGDGQREVLGLKVGASEAELFWTNLLRSLNWRWLRGVKLVISDSQEGVRVGPRRS